MISVPLSRIDAPSIKAIRGVTDIVRLLFKADAARRRQQRAAAQLRSLGDHGLRDLGIHRSEVLSVAGTINVDRDRRRNADA